MIRRLLLVTLLFAVPCAAQTNQTHHSKRLSLVKHLGWHIALGVVAYGSVNEVSRATGSHSPYWPGLLATGIVAAIKEGTDAHDGKDTKWEAAWHAATIEGTAGVIAAVAH